MLQQEENYKAELRRSLKRLPNVFTLRLAKRLLTENTALKRMGKWHRLIQRTANNAEAAVRGAARKILMKLSP